MIQKILLKMQDIFVLLRWKGKKKSTNLDPTLTFSSRGNGDIWKKRGDTFTLKVFGHN